MPRLTTRKAINCLGLLFIIAGCINANHNIPFPAQETEFAKPVSRPFTFSEPRKIDWIVTDIDTLNFPPPKKIDFDKIPSKPFYPDGFYPFSQPMAEAKFDFGNLPDTFFNYNDLPTEPLRFKTYLLEPPTVIEAGIPKLKEKAALGIFEFREEHGLPGSFVSAIMGDTKGMLWIATDKGLCRFNGEYLEIYSFVDRVFNGGFATINKLLEDEQGRIWCKTDLKGVYVLDWKAGLVLHLDIPAGYENFNTQVSDNEMLKDSRGLIWVGTSQNGIFIVDQQKGTIRHLLQMPKTGDKYTKEIIEDGEGKIWVGTHNGVHIIDVRAKKISYLSQAHGLSSPDISTLFKDSEERIWIGTVKSVDIIDMKSAMINHLGKEQGIDKVVRNVIRDSKHKTWLSTSGGLYVLDDSLKKLRHITVSDGLSENDIKSIAIDNDGQIWIGTSTGADLINTKGVIPEHLNEKYGLSNSDIWTLVQDSQQRIWVGANKTIDVYDPLKNTIQNVFPYSGLNAWPYGDQYIQIFKDHKNQLWIAAPDDGVYLFDPKTGTTQQVKHVKNNNIISVIEDHLGQIWTCGWFGITVFDKHRRSYKYFDINHGSFDNKAWSLAEDELGRIWVTMDTAIGVIDPAKGTLQELKQEKNSKQISNPVLWDSEGRIWIGSNDGLRVVDLKTQTITRFTPKEGLCAPDVYTIYKYKASIYIGTGNGLTVFTPPNKKPLSDVRDWSIQSYGKEQGLISRNFNSGAALGIGNKMWWGVYPVMLTITDIPEEDSVINPAYITGISIADNPQYFIDKRWIQKNLVSDTLWDALNDTFAVKNNLPRDNGYLQKNNIKWDSIDGAYPLPVHLRLPHHQNHLTFYFAGNHFRDPDKTRYRYILEGNDDEWSAVTNRSFADYRNLSPGKYTFKVSSKAAYGLWSTPAELRFTILPPPWQTWWAYLLYALAVAATIWLIVRYRSLNLKKQNLRLEQKVITRTNELNQSLERLKTTQSQLIQSEKMASLGELTAGIAHEIQNPLNFVNNFSEVNNELIEELKMKNEKLKIEDGEVNELLNDIAQNLEKINFHGRRADAIVKGMLEHSRTSSGQKELTNINKLADEYLRLAYHGLRAKDKLFNTEIRTEFDESIGKINIVSQDIGRVLLNLYNNAFYAVNEKRKTADEDYQPTVTVQTKKLNSRIEISVRDNGNGISQKVVDKIFQPFFTTKPTGQGTGLGLSLAYDIIKADGGDIKVETRDGEGSEFKIELDAR